MLRPTVKLPEGATWPRYDKAFGLLNSGKQDVLHGSPMQLFSINDNGGDRQDDNDSRWRQKLKIVYQIANLSFLFRVVVAQKNIAFCWLVQQPGPTSESSWLGWDRHRQKKAPEGSANSTIIECFLCCSDFWPENSNSTAADRFPYAPAMSSVFLSVPDRCFRASTAAAVWLRIGGTERCCSNAISIVVKMKQPKDAQNDKSRNSATRFYK